MDNYTFNADIIFLEGLKVSPGSTTTIFIFLLLIYIFIMVANLGLVLLISMEPSLHQPMYLLFCNMSINDSFGASVVIPRLLADMYVPISERLIHYVECVVQAFAAHFHAGTSHTVLMVMAFDRYIAICNPLHYSTVMSGHTVLKLSVAAWAVAFILVAVLIGLSVRLSRCRHFVFNPMCDNASLFKLSCDNLMANHIYGLCSAVVLLGSSLGSMALTYLRITIVCLSNRNKVLNSRALQTCATHLAVYFIMLVASFTPMIMHRYPKWTENGKVASVLFHVAPPALNPLIYGLQCKDLRLKIFSIFGQRLKGKTMG